MDGIQRKVSDDGRKGCGIARLGANGSSQQEGFAARTMFQPNSSGSMSEELNCATGIKPGYFVVAHDQDAVVMRLVDDVVDASGLIV